MNSLFNKFYVLLLATVTSCSASSQLPPGEHYLLVGTYTSGRSEGIYVFKFNSDKGSFEPVSIAKGIRNPSYLAVAPGNRYVYSVSEGEGQGSITSYSFNNGTLTTLNVQPSGGIAPCYISVHKSGKWVVTGNYSSGTFAVLPVQNDGSLASPSTVITHKGNSVNKQRQEGPHVHATVFSPDNNFLFVPDLGMDKVMIYSFNEKTGGVQPAAQTFAATEPGSGPRHFEFHPNGRYAYLMEEMSGTVTVFQTGNAPKSKQTGSAQKAMLKAIQNISSHPAGYKGSIGSADIHVSPDGKFLYASNRGESNSIAIFSINDKTGKLIPIGHQSTLGIKPRNFNIDPTGNFLLVANQESNNIVIFRRDKKTGKLNPIEQQIEVPNPVCLKFISGK
ncbi:MAG TPA: lactonase family protein [Chitinophagaceae bacterium]